MASEMNNVLIDSTGTMYFGEERETARNCPSCHAFSRMSPTAVPTFDSLLLQKPRSIGVVLRCHACNAPVFLRYATRAFANNRIELSPQAFDVERAIEKFAFNYVPEDVETFFREALICYSHNQFQAFASMCRRTAAVTFADLGNSTKLRLFDSLSDVREMAEIDEEHLRGGHAHDLRRQRRAAARPADHRHLPGGGDAGSHEGLSLPGLRPQGPPAAGDEGAQVLRRRKPRRAASAATTEKWGHPMSHYKPTHLRALPNMRYQPEYSPAPSGRQEFCA